MGRISRRAADHIKEVWQAHKGRKPGGAGFADPGLPIRLAKTTVNHVQGETEDVTLMWGDKGDETEGAQPRDTVEVYNRFGDVPEDAEVFIAKIAGKWEILNTGRVLIVEITSTVGPGKAGTGRVQKITNDPDTIASGDTVTLADVSPTKNVVVINFRPNWLAAGVAYLAHQFGDFWVIENDACFQDFMA